MEAVFPGWRFAPASEKAGFSDSNRHAGLSLPLGGEMRMRIRKK